MYLALAKNTKRIDAVDLELKKNYLKNNIFIFIKRILTINNCFL